MSHVRAKSYIHEGKFQPQLSSQLDLLYSNGIFKDNVIGPKMDRVTGGWRKLLNEEVHNLYSSPSIIRIIKSRRMRWAGHVTRMG
jgi:hypothetical protein